MSFALCLRFDRETSEAIEQIWRALEQARVSSDMLELGYPPHLTLIVTSDEADVGDLARSLTVLAGHVPAAVELGEARMFPASEVAYLACSGELADLQRLAAELVPASTLHEHYRPGAWTPHVTLQTRGAAVRAVAVAGERWQTRRAVPVALDLVAFPPVAVHASVAIGQR